MGLEGRLDGAIEVEVERDVAELAVALGRELLEAARLLGRGQAARADEAPPQLEEPRRHRVKERAEHLAAVDAPLVGEREGPGAHDVRVGAAG